MSHLAAHYQKPDLDQVIRNTLETIKRDGGDFDPNIIAAIDQFHIGGAQATRDMLQLAQFKSADLILDIGCGLGGPARLIAKECQAQTIGLDLSYDYCLAANLISEQLKVSDQTAFIQGNAVHLPFTDNSFDGIWTQHVTMNIENKALLFKEFSRILKPRGKLVMYEVFRPTTATRKLAYPLPWSVDGKHSFLDNVEHYSDMIESSGCALKIFTNVTTIANTSVKKLLKRFDNNQMPKANLGLLLGTNYRNMMQNLNKALSSGSLQVFQIVAQKQGHN